MKKIEKCAAILIALWILQCICAGLMPFLLSQIVVAGKTSEAITGLKILAASIATVTGFGTSIACGIWLFLEAKRENQQYWVWCLMGLCFKINAVILFFVWLAFQEIRQMRIKTSAPDSTLP